LKPFYIDINGKRGSVTLKEMGSEKEENVQLTFIEFMCRGVGPCKVRDYALVMKNP